MADRKKLLEGTRDKLKRIDAVLLEASNTSLAARVERLVASAAGGSENCFDDDCPCGCDEVQDVMYGSDVFSPLYKDDDQPNNVDALRYMATYNPEARIRIDYAADGEDCWFPSEHLDGTVTVADALTMNLKRLRSGVRRGARLQRVLAALRNDNVDDERVERVLRATDDVLLTLLQQYGDDDDDEDEDELTDSDVQWILDTLDGDDETMECLVGRWINIEGHGTFRWHIDAITDLDGEIFRAHIAGDDYSQQFHVSAITRIFDP